MGTSIIKDNNKYPVKSQDDLLNLKTYCEKAVNNYEFIFHYTKLNSLIGMLKNHKLHFTSTKSTNDLQESIDSNSAHRNNLYIVSFTSNMRESLAMWHVYGNPFEKSVRLRFKTSLIKQMINQSSGAPCYSIDIDKERNTYHEIGCIKSLRLIDVSYVTIKNKDASFRKNRYLSYNLNFEKDYSTNLRNDDFVGFFKNKGWDYEKETRLLLEIESNSSSQNHDHIEKIAIDAPNIFSDMCIRCSPCFDKGDLKKEPCMEGFFSDNRFKMRLQNSRYLWKVHFQDKCSLCKTANPMCPHMKPQ